MWKKGGVSELRLGSRALSCSKRPLGVDSKRANRASGGREPSDWLGTLTGRKSQPLLDLGTKIMMLRIDRFTNPKFCFP
jgi:hypothetical protein